MSLIYPKTPEELARDFDAKMGIQAPRESRCPECGLTLPGGERKYCGSDCRITAAVYGDKPQL